MRADRILSIMLLLQSRGKMSTRELAEKLEVSQRSISRDMEALSMSGVPVYAERGSRGGWVLAEGYRTNLTGMKTEELLSLLLSAHAELLSDLGIQQHYETALQKLLASSPASLRDSTARVWDKIHIDGSGWHQANETCPCLSTVQTAVLTEHKLQIKYKRDEEIVERIVHPLGLVAKRTVWYLATETNGELRTYRISRIVHAEVMDEPFPRPADFNLAQYWEHSTAQFKQSLPKYPVMLRLSKTSLARLEQDRYVQVQQMTQLEDDWAEATIVFATLEHACEIILGFGASIKVISPEELKARLRSEAQSMVDRYAEG